MFWKVIVNNRDILIGLIRKTSIYLAPISIYMDGTYLEISDAKQQIEVYR
jgi:hypothetical protein